MQAQQAIDVINNLAYKPGWEFSARPVPTWFRDAYANVRGESLPEQMIVFSYKIETVNTDRDNARSGYPEGRTLDADDPMDVTVFNGEDDLMFHLFQLIMELELHESREFFRRKDQGWEAPFHPHKDDANELWEACMTRAETN
jgi:hypothetical protein